MSANVYLAPDLSDEEFAAIMRAARAENAADGWVRPPDEANNTDNP